MTLSPVLPDHLSHAKVGGAPPKHAPDGVSITYVDACEAAAVLRSMVPNRAAISELPTMSFVVATFVSTGESGFHLRL